MRLVLLATFGFAVATQVAQAQSLDCGAVANTVLSQAKVLSAVAEPAGPFSVPAARPLKEQVVDLPAYCRIRGEAEPKVGFELWLPMNWNGRLVAVGSGGFGGSIGYRDMVTHLAGGYAVTANDTGHTDQTFNWMHDPKALYAWGHSATHAVVVPAKTLVQAFYGRPAAYAYFLGCSTGGAQAMEEAEFYPGDFDGIAASCPGMHYSHLMLSFLWGLKVTTDHALLAPEKLQLLHAAVMNRCDGLDGVKDGLLENPPACRFDPRVLQCRSEPAAGCLTKPEVTTAQLLYRGPRNPRTGEQIYPGFVPGSEASPLFTGPLSSAYGWTLIQKPLAEQYAVPLLKNLAFGEQWDWRTFDFDKDVARFDAAVHAKIDAVSPDLRAFQALGGKLIMVQGWGDPLNAQTLPIGYRDGVIKLFARQGKASAVVASFFRLFMAPGMSHCMGGPGPSKFDLLGPLRDWVEKGRAPDRMVATKVDIFAGGNAGGTMTRPLCPYPQITRWTGTGSTNDAANFMCAAPKAREGR